MLRVAKAKGWNKRKVQRRFMWFLWRDIEGETYHSKDLAALAMIKISAETGEDFISWAH